MGQGCLTVWAFLCFATAHTAPDQSIHNAQPSHESPAASDIESASNPMEKVETESSSEVSAARERGGFLVQTVPKIWMLNLTWCDAHVRTPMRQEVNHTMEGGDQLAMSEMLMAGTNKEYWCILWPAAKAGEYLTMVVETFLAEVVGTRECMEVAGFLMYTDNNKQSYKIRPCTGRVIVAFDPPPQDVVQLFLAFNQEKITLPENVHIILTIMFYATSLSAQRLVKHTPVSDHSGYVSSFLFDGVTFSSRHHHARFTITVRSGHVVFISFLHNDVSCKDSSLKMNEKYREEGAPQPRGDYDAFQITTAEISSTTTLTWWGCGRKYVEPRAYTQPLEFEYTTGALGRSTGFRFLYSVHKAAQVLPKLDSGLFNCSVPYYPDYDDHFRCNLEVECANMEDEVSCPYTSPDCGPGLIAAGSKCYKFVHATETTSWLGAYAKCLEQGLVMVSPKSQAEWDEFKDVLKLAVNYTEVFVGLRTSDETLPSYYREVWQWADGSMAYYHKLWVNTRVPKPQCTVIPGMRRDQLADIGCGSGLSEGAFYFCESLKSSQRRMPPPPISLDVPFETEHSTRRNVTLVKCPDGHLTQEFLSCDLLNQCGVSSYVTSCQTTAGNVPMFTCDVGLQTLHYTLICDFQKHCVDGSDETFCQHRQCRERQCKNQQCVTTDQWCDGVQHCKDASDEQCPQYVSKGRPIAFPPAKIDLDGRGNYKETTIFRSEDCPATHFLCSDGYCLPVFLRCNGVHDCVDMADETSCGEVTCPGYYKCHDSTICLHTDHVCDGVSQCPQQDDELLCGMDCPAGCRCQGLAFICPRTFPVRLYPDLRYLDATGSGMVPDEFTENVYLVSLTLADCNLQNVTAIHNPNLRMLDLSFNHILTVDMNSFRHLQNLRYVRLSHNPLASLQTGDSGFILKHVGSLDLSGTQLETFTGDFLVSFPNVKLLNISDALLNRISVRGFNSTQYLEVLDLRGSPLDVFPDDLLRNHLHLKVIYATNFKLCCPAMLPDQFNVKNCHAPADEIASCKDLLRANVYRGCLWIMSLLALVGNAGSLLARQLTQTKSRKSTFNLFVTNLNIADFLMGLYLAAVGTADSMYRGNYLWYDSTWKRSFLCTAAGFLSLLSSEVSAFFVCLITLDRFLAVRFVLSGWNFQFKSGFIACIAAWLLAILLAAIPLLPMTSHWEFYSQTSICIPLPITRSTFKGRTYSFVIMIVVNFTIFMLIAVGQALIYGSVQKNSFKSDKSNARESTVARRLTLIVVSDFLCWFPIGLLGILASLGNAIPSEVNVAMAIFVLPVNSALNPFLYTVNIILEKQREAVKARLLEQLTKQLENRGHGQRDS